MPTDDHIFRLRYVGDRFKDAHLPLDVLNDLPAFRDLLVSFAKQAWLSKNPSRKRLPRGFDKSFAFDLVGIDHGSAVPKIEWNRAEAQALLPGMTDDLSSIVADAYQEITDLFAGAANSNVADKLSTQQIRALNRFGSGLKQGEQIEFSGQYDKDGNVIYLDIGKRKSLITNQSGTYVQRYEGVGELSGAWVSEDKASGSVFVATDKYGVITIPIEVDRVVDEFDGNINQQVQFDISVELDRDDVVKGVKIVHEIDLVDDITVVAPARSEMISSLKNLSSGWLDGERGAVIQDHALEAASLLLDLEVSRSKDIKIYPTENGGVLLEFLHGGWDYSVEINEDRSIEFFGIEVDGSGEFGPSEYAGYSVEFIKEFENKISGKAFGEG
ncbi:hypothetical protein OB03_09555 [Brevundimonas sp. GN22]